MRDPYNPCPFAASDIAEAVSTPVHHILYYDVFVFFESARKPIEAIKSFTTFLWKKCCRDQKKNQQIQKLYLFEIFAITYLFGLRNHVK